MDPPHRASAALVAIHLGRQLDLLPDETLTVGRSPHLPNLCRFDHPSISARHCEFIVTKEGNVEIIDTSTNGTFVNYVKLTKNKPLILEDGDIVRLSRVTEFELRVEYSSHSSSTGCPPNGTLCATIPAFIDRMPLREFEEKFPQLSTGWVDTQGRSLLCTFAEAGRLDVVAFILQQGKAADYDKEVAMSAAAKLGHTSILELLLAANVDANAHTKGDAPLHFAAKGGHLDAVSTLLKHGAKPDVKNQRGATPLLLACQSRHPQVVQALLLHHADPNSLVLPDCVFPLYEAVLTGNRQIICSLLDHDANVDMQTRSGDSPIELAERLGLSMVVDLLRGGRDHGNFVLPPGLCGAQCDGTGTTATSISSCSSCWTPPTQEPLSDRSYADQHVPDAIPTSVICHACASPILEMEVVAMDRHWHPDCFTCHRCGMRLKGGYITVDDDGVPVPLHEQCLDASPTIENQCPRCGLEVIGGSLPQPTVAEGTYHRVHPLCVDTCALQAMGYECKATGMAFLDPTFPASAASIRQPHDPPLSLAPIGWSCSTTYAKYHGFAMPLALFPTKISPLTLRQGHFCNWWFLSALAVLAENPVVLRRLFWLSETEEEVGYYELALCKNGLWRTVIVDDLLPVAEDGKIFFCWNTDESLWGSLVEKAYAKLHGSYGSLASGRCHEALADLSGFPAREVPLSTEGKLCVNPKELWADLQEWVWRKYLISAGTPTEDVAHSQGIGAEVKVVDKLQELGLLPGRGYSVLGTTLLSNGTRLLQMRDPWGIAKWSGDWSHDSSLWTTALRCEVSSDESNGGMFYICLDDFLKCFATLSIAYHEPLWLDIRVQALFQSTGTIFAEVSVQLPTEAIFTVYQPDRRGVTGDPAFEYTIACITVLQPMDDGSYSLLATTNYCSDRDLICIVELDPNPEPYLVIPHAPYYDKERPFVLGMSLQHGKSSKVVLRQGTFALWYISALYMAYSLGTSTIKHIEDKAEWVSYGTKHAHICILNNHSTESDVHVSLDTSSSARLVPYIGAVDHTEAIVSPSRAAIVFLGIGSGTWAYNYEFKYSIEPASGEVQDGVDFPPVIHGNEYPICECELQVNGVSQRGAIIDRGAVRITRPPVHLLPELGIDT